MIFAAYTLRIMKGSDYMLFKKKKKKNNGDKGYTYAICVEMRNRIRLYMEENERLMKQLSSKANELSEKQFTDISDEIYVNEAKIRELRSLLAFDFGLDLDQIFS